MSNVAHAPGEPIVTVDGYKCVVRCTCGQRFVDYGRTQPLARQKALRALNSHRVMVGAFAATQKAGTRVIEIPAN
jgi:hypothetical protein